MPRNILNLDELTSFLEDVYIDATVLHDRDAAHDWVFGTARRWIVNEFPVVGRVGGVLRRESADNTAVVSVSWPEEVDWNGPRRVVLQDAAWLDQAIEQGAFVLGLQSEQATELKQKLCAATSFVDFEAGKVGPARARRIAVPQAIAGGGRLTGASIGVPDRDGAFRLYEFEDGCYVDMLVGKDSLLREGDRMHHCVGGYVPAIRRGECQILSLRDPGGNPHITMEVTAGRLIVQIKGKCNRAVHPKYRPYLPELFAALGLQPQRDHEMAGVLHRGFSCSDPLSWRAHTGIDEVVKDGMCGRYALTYWDFSEDVKLAVKDAPSEDLEWIVDRFRGPDGGFVIVQRRSPLDVYGTLLPRYRIGVASGLRDALRTASVSGRSILREVEASTFAALAELDNAYPSALLEVPEHLKQWPFEFSQQRAERRERFGRLLKPVGVSGRRQLKQAGVLNLRKRVWKQNWASLQGFVHGQPGDYW